VKVAQLFRLSPSSLAAGYIAVGVLALALFAIPLWYGWNVNSATFKVYLQGEEVQGLVDVFGREGATGLAAAIEAKLATLPDDEVIALADPSKKRLAGNLPAWPPEIPDAPGTFGLEISRGEQASMRVVVTHVRLPGGYHLLVGRASVMRFEFLMKFFWYGIAGATAIILVLGAVGWLIRREGKEADDRLRRSEAFLAEGQRISLTGSWGWNPSTGTVIWSDQQYRMLGFAPGEVEPSVDLFLKVVHPEDRPRVRQGLEEAIRELRSYAIDYRIVLQDGSVRHMRSVGRPVATGDGRVEEYIGVTTDTTERVQAEAALRRAQRLEATGTLAGGIAHDFNNILGAILGYGEMAQRDAPKGSRLRRDLESIMAAGERGRALVDRILTFSRSGVGERVPVHVEKVVREALDLLMAKLPPNVTIKADLRAGRAAMRGDPTQIHQVVMNLATNGIQAMDAGGTLRVSLGRTRVDTQHIATTGTIAGGDYIVLKVSDSGSGIPPGILDRIFDPFFSTKEVGVGTGLGLSLVHGIVTEVGGAINVETKVGAGSVFTVYLPRDGEVRDGPKDEQPELPRGEQQRILVVDDEEPLVRLATETLRELGYMPIGFTSSTDALAAFRFDPKQFDAVITDERMPGISGSALIREMRGIRRSIPILLVSGFVGGLVVGRAYNSGATEVLKKPLSAQELATSLARVLQQ